MTAEVLPNAGSTGYSWVTAHRSEAGDALVAHPGLVSGPIPYAKEGH